MILRRKRREINLPDFWTWEDLSVTTGGIKEDEFSLELLNPSETPSETPSEITFNEGLSLH